MHHNQNQNSMQAGPANAYLSQQVNQSAMNTSSQQQPPNAHIFSQQSHYLLTGQMQQNFPGRNEASNSEMQPGFPQALPNTSANSTNFSGEAGTNQGFSSFQQNLNRSEDKAIPLYQTQPNFQQQLPQHRLPVQPSLATVSSAAFPRQTVGISSMHGATKPAALELRLQNIHPSILPREMLQNLDRLTVEALCALGREIIQLNTNRNAPIDVESIMSYCQNLFSKLAEIRIRIDLKRSAEATANGTTVELNTRISDEKLFEVFSSPPSITKANSRKQMLTQEFEANRAQLIRLSNQMKKLDWLASVSDPRFLKKD